MQNKWTHCWKNGKCQRRRCAQFNKCRWACRGKSMVKSRVQLKGDRAGSPGRLLSHQALNYTGSPLARLEIHMLPQNKAMLCSQTMWKQHIGTYARVYVCVYVWYWLGICSRAGRRTTSQWGLRGGGREKTARQRGKWRTRQHDASCIFHAVRARGAEAMTAEWIAGSVFISKQVTPRNYLHTYSWSN